MFTPYYHVRRSVDAALVTSRIFCISPLLGTKTRYLKKFEDRFSNFFQSEVVGVGSGTEALMVTLKALDVKVGDKVIIPSYSCPAVLVALRSIGAQPIFVDIESETLATDPRSLSDRLTKDVKAIIYTHLFGMVGTSRMKVVEQAEFHNIPVIEDISHVLGLNIVDLGTIKCASCSTGKVITTQGNAGLICSTNITLIDRCRTIASYGARVRDRDYAEIGFNARLDDIHAGVLCVSLNYFEAQKRHLYKQTELYRKLLRSCSSVTFLNSNSSEQVYPGLPILLPDRDKILERFSSLEQYLKRPYITPLPELFVTQRFESNFYPNTFKLVNEISLLPLGPIIANTTITQICGLISEYYKTR